MHFKNTNTTDITELIILNYKLGLFKNSLYTDSRNFLNIKYITSYVFYKTNNSVYSKQDYENILILITYLNRLSGQCNTILNIEKSKDINNNYTIFKIGCEVSNNYKYSFSYILIKFLRLVKKIDKNNKDKLRLKMQHKNCIIYHFMYKKAYNLFPFLEIEDNTLNFKYFTKITLKHNNIKTF